MTPEQCRELAEFHEHMANWCVGRSIDCDDLVAVAVLQAAAQYSESARYWREKADG